RVELEAAERGIEREQQRAPALAEPAVGGGAGHLLGRRGHAAPSRSARLTAFRTTSSLSSAARCNTSRASGVRLFPNAMAAQARGAADSFMRSRPRGSSRPLSGLMPAGPAIAP